MSKQSHNGMWTFHPSQMWTWLASPPLTHPKGVACDGSDLCFCIACMPWGPTSAGAAIPVYAAAVEYNATHVSTKQGELVVARRR